MAGFLSIPIGYKLDNRSLKNAEKEFKGFGHSIKGIMAGIGAGFAVDKLFELGKESVKLATEDIKSQKLLERQLRVTTHATDAQLSTNDKWIASLARTVGMMDDKLRPALANAVRGTGSLSQGQRLLKIALDGSAATGKPLNAVLTALIKATNGQTTSLYRLAPELKKSKGGIDAFAASVKGAAALAADPFDRFKVATDQLKEKFGKLLLPMLTDFVDYMNVKVVPAVSNFLDQVGNPKTDAGKMFLQIKDAVKQTFKDVQGFFALFGNGDAMKGFANVASALVKALPALLALKGIMALSAAGGAIKNLVNAVKIIIGAKGVTSGDGNKTPLGYFKGLPSWIKTGLGVVGEAAVVASIPSSTQQMDPKWAKSHMLALKNYRTPGVPTPLVVSKTPAPTIVVNSYGSTPADFTKLVYKAFQEHNRLNGK